MGGQMQVDNLYVKGLPNDTTDKEFLSVFEPYGRVLSYKLMARANMPVATAMVRYPDRYCAEDAIEALNGRIPELLLSRMDPSKGLEVRFARADNAGPVPGCPRRAGGSGRDGPPPPRGGPARGGPYDRPHGGKGHRGMPPGGRQRDDRWDDRGDGRYDQRWDDRWDDRRPREPAHGRGRPPPDFDDTFDALWSQPPAAGRPAQHHALPQPTAQQRALGVVPLSAQEQVERLREVAHPLLGQTSAVPGSAAVRVHSLPDWVDHSGLYYLFAPYGAICECVVEEGLGSALVRFTERRAAEEAAAQLTGFIVDGVPITAQLEV